MKKYFSILTIIFFTLSCKKTSQEVEIVKQNSIKEFDTTKGYFVEYPATIKEDYLEIEDSHFYHFTLNKVLTKDNTTYRLELYKSNGGGFDIEIPIELGVAIGSINLMNNIDTEFEKEFGKSNESKCVVKFYNGTAPTLWNYEFSINKKGEVMLKNIFFYCNIKKMIEIKGVKDTVAQFVKFPINENINKINKEKIYSINMFENWKNIEKVEKWRIE